MKGVTVSQFKFRKPISLIFLGLCLVMSGSWGQISDEIDVEQKKLDDQWRERFWSYLESSEYPQFRTRAAIRLIRTGDPLAIEQGEQIMLLSLCCISAKLSLRKP